MLQFSVLLSLYYKESPLFLSQSLHSLFSQTLLPSEVILVKDGPLNNDLERVISEFQRQYSLLKTISLPTNQGLGYALNEGMKYCSYDLVARMDTDDIAKPDRFQKQMEVFSRNPDVDVCGTWVDEFEDNILNVNSIRKVPEFHKDILRFAKRRNPINHPTVMFKKSSVLRAGGYMHFPYFEDYYLWVRMLNKGAVFYNIQESLLSFRVSPDMFKRRGGFKYAMTELRLQFVYLKMGFISFPCFVKNVLIRFITRLIPNSLRSYLYKKIVRS